MENDNVQDTAVTETVEKIISENNVHTLIIRKDDALKVYEEKSISLSGVLDSPARWIETRTTLHEGLAAHVIVDREKMTIQLITEERNHFSNSVTGKLEFHPAFLKFGINSDDYISPFAMADKIKMNRSFFTSKSEAMALVSTLKNFKAKIDGTVEKMNDNRGNRRELIEAAVSSNLPESFKMKLPIFKGEAPKEIEVEVYINSDLECTLQSPEANDEIESLRNSAINLVLDRISKVDPEIVIIEK